MIFTDVIFIAIFTVILILTPIFKFKLNIVNNIRLISYIMIVYFGVEISETALKLSWPIALTIAIAYLLILTAITKKIETYIKAQNDESHTS